MKAAAPTAIHFPPSHRIAASQPYFFAQLDQKLAMLRADGVDVIRLDMGSPDMPPPAVIVDRLVEGARRADSHGYAPLSAAAEYKRACAHYYRQRFQVALDEQHEVLALIGSKEGLFATSQVLLNPGDVSLVPNPAYPVYSSGSRIAGAEVVSMPLREENGYLPDLEAIPLETLRRARLLWLNYPNNPTGAVAPLSFFKETVAFCRRHKILVVHDAPYVDVGFEGYAAPSILQVDGAKDVALEFNSLSKTYNMAGWRLGMAVGNAQVISYLQTYKSFVDSANFAPAFMAGAAALTGDQRWLVERNQIYQQRRDILVAGLRKAGLRINEPAAAIYVWAALPIGAGTSAEYCTRLLMETGVSTTPGSVYGAAGEGYLRVSLTTDTSRIEEAVQRILLWSEHAVANQQRSIPKGEYGQENI